MAFSPPRAGGATFPLVAAAALLLGPLARKSVAQDFGDPPQAAPPPPEFVNRKQPLPPQILEDKTEGRYITGIPMIGVDPEEGTILGAAVQFYDDGPRSNPLFAYTPYRQMIEVAAVFGVQRNVTSIYAILDQPYIDDTPWRIKAYAGYKENTFQNYFGTGEQTLEALHFPGSTQTFRKIREFNEAIRSTAGGITWADFVDYHQQMLLGAVNLEYDTLGGLLRPLVGLQIGHMGVTDYTGRTVDGAIEQETKLAQDERLGKIRGFDGGWDNSIRVGLAYDTRDYEPDPTSGVLAQTFVSGAFRPIGSTFTYGQATFGLSGYTPIVPDYNRLVAAANAIYSMRFGDVPFYAMNRLPLPRDEVRTGLGGFPTLRGYSSNRFVGMTTIGANAELRWSFSEFTLFDQHLKTALAPFVDVGRVFDSTGGFSFQDWKYSAGIGLRLAWNLATVISFDYGVSPEGTLFFMQLGHGF